jgi:hypothetical protein
MRINLMHPELTVPRPTAPRPVVLPALAVALVAALAVAFAFAAAQIAGPESSAPQAKPHAHASPGTLTRSERAAVTAALRSPDAHTRRLAISVAAGEAGSLALADPSTLHHHGVNTAAAPAHHESGSPERFHHR